MPVFYRNELHLNYNRFVIRSAYKVSPGTVPTTTTTKIFHSWDETLHQRRPRTNTQIWNTTIQIKGLDDLRFSFTGGRGRWGEGEGRFLLQLGLVINNFRKSLRLNFDKVYNRLSTKELCLCCLWEKDKLFIFHIIQLNPISKLPVKKRKCMYGKNRFISKLQKWKPSFLFHIS